MDAESENFQQRCLLLDLEINEDKVIYSIGAVLGEQSVQSPVGSAVAPKILAELDRLGQEADYLLGHNILNHDIPCLREAAPGLSLLQKPAIDTLYLSPLAFPANPYHRLVKNYQLVRDSINDPVQDARLAGRVFAEQWAALNAQLAKGMEAPLFYRSFFHHDPSLLGTAQALAAMGIPLLQGEELLQSFAGFGRSHACATAVDRLVEELDQLRDYPQLAYVTAWLTVAGGNSVLPPWVRHHFPRIGPILQRLRAHNCRQPDCDYCRSHHNPRHFLHNFFGFEQFRPQPADQEGNSLQEVVVAAGADNHSLLATLPTGGGKSLCYLLPGIMRYQQRNLLTIVISPLQALMKDQVDNVSEQTGTTIAAALYGMLTMVERSAVQEAICLGDIGILYVSPEQLRNHSFISTISQREIGAWVFDEAHCLSKWGHDFRPDYFYAIRFIREFAQKAKTAIPPVQCYTATAKQDVKTEIVDTIQRQLGLQVQLFEGGHERSNLNYEVFASDSYSKEQVILELLRERYQGEGSVVIYCATKKHCEQLAASLQGAGYRVEPFHAGLENSRKKQLQEDFIQGELPMICATNAFGMGIDKEDVRLVLHADIPGSLENYLQEAGRAGRDRRQAECILVFAEQDIEKQFQLGALSRLSKREISQIWRGISKAAKDGDRVVMTPGELLRQEVVELNPEELYDGDTRVRTAVAWLERAGFLERNENNTRVFQGKPLVRNLGEAALKIAELDLSQRQQQRWLAIVAALMDRQRQDGFSADELAGLSAFACGEDEPPDQTETQRVMKTLQDMAEQRILSKETTMTAFVRYKVRDHSAKRLQRICALERDFLRLMVEEAPEAEPGLALELDLRQLNQRLLDRDNPDCTPELLKRLLHGLTRDGRGIAGQSGSLMLRARGGHRFTLSLQRDWQALKTTMKIRQQAAQIALKVILQAIAPTEKANGSLLVEFSLEEIIAALGQDLALRPLLRKPLAAAERALLFMHELTILELQQGLAIFKQAMTLQLQPQPKGRRYSAADFSPLKTHYSERTFQVHVMNEYARQALVKISTAMRLVRSYFDDDKEDFIRRFFPGRKTLLERATSEQSYQRIVEDLANPHQAAIVAAPTEQNILVLAGPGAGKTRVVTHRVAYLLRVERIRPRSILVLCFNRSAVMSLRRRLGELVGDDLGRVTTLTFHGLALRLTGRSLAAGVRQHGEEIDFSRLISEAIQLLKGESQALDFGDTSPWDTLVGRFSHILVDEYQDIDEQQYQLVALLAGRDGSRQEPEQKLTIMAVGDDDQNIYRFRGANVDFIRRFKEDYQAEVHYLVENYRSTANIIAAANSLISHNRDRMKSDHPIRVNQARETLPRGGNLERNDPLVRGRVQLLQAADPREQGYGLLAELRRLEGLESGLDLAGCAVLAREWQQLDLPRSLLEAEGLPINLHWGSGSGFPSLARIREHALVLEYLEQHRLQSLAASQLLLLLSGQKREESVWQDNARQLIREWQEESHDTPQPVSLIQDYLYEALADQGRSKNLNNGIFLSTIHSVKGLEFDHVFLLGGQRQGLQGAELEEERRLSYVGMSRARRSLSLFALDQGNNPQITELDRDLGRETLCRRRLSPVAKSAHPEYHYQLLGMKELFIDFAGFRPQGHPVRKAIAGLQSGTLLTARRQREQIELLDSSGIAVARLSRAARMAWWEQLEEISEIRVVALVRRYLEDIREPSFQKRCHGPSWEVPLVEIRSSSRPWPEHPCSPAPPL
ncbi:RecQ family ATP-dependent DNA helicase [Desulfogranum mediterraneum]|uniref:RecQ family ATP-dependent DNA helicase n=1 Tax=Desulfogranum mediterraneum TaxID=160661 RepID=UPI0006880ED8|nr:RecQ family ATP-dependent DNA helicase [Desulfogranum mediterraneum]